MQSGLIPHRYAMALYKYAAETKKTREVYEEMKTFIKSYLANPGMDKVLSNPFVKAADKRAVLLAAAGKPGEDFQRFVTLILDHRREEFAILMALAYRDIYRTENHISQVRITTAAQLPEAEMKKLRSVVEKSFGGVTFEYEYSVDPALIGGFVIDVDSTRMDASLSGELEQLRQNLSSN